MSGLNLEDESWNGPPMPRSFKCPRCHGLHFDMTSKRCASCGLTKRGMLQGNWSPWVSTTFMKEPEEPEFSSIKICQGYRDATGGLCP